MEQDVNDNNGIENIIFPDLKFQETENTTNDSPGIIKDKYEVPAIDVFTESEKYILEFDEACKNTGTGYEAPSFSLFSSKMEGLQNGFYIVAGFPNSGKSAFALNLSMDYAMNPDNHLFLIYYSLDDTKEDIMARIVAMNVSIPISVVRKPNRYQQKIDEGSEGASKFQKLLEKRQEGISQLQTMSKNFMVKDAEDIDCAEKMLNHAKMVKRYLKARDEKANVIIVIDSLMDVNIDSKNFREERDRNTQISQLIKKYATTEIECPIFGTAHVRKNSAKRVSISDLKESGRYEYDAKAVFLVTNDVSRNGQSAEIYYQAPNDTTKRPVLEIQWAKNKASSFKERTYCYFAPEFSKAVECDERQTENFDAIIYQD